MSNDEQLSLDFSDTITVPISNSYNYPYDLTINGKSTGSFSLDNTITQIGVDNSYAITTTTLTDEKVKVLDEMKEWMSEVDSKLAILKPNEKLEEEWAELKEIRNRYVELEKELTEKSLMWNILKDE
jgi:YbbR domain-containing protein